jgi:hypothetical protein
MQLLRQQSSYRAILDSRNDHTSLRWPTWGSLKRLDWMDITGSITAGGCDSIKLVPAHDPVGTLVLYANEFDIDMVFINREVVKSKDKLTCVE